MKIRTSKSNWKLRFKNWDSFGIFLSLIWLLPQQVSAQVAWAAGGSDEALIERAMEGSEFILKRDFDQALQIFRELETNYPKHPAGGFGQMAVYEIWMLENEDHRFDEPYQEVAERALKLMESLPAKGRLTQYDMFFLSAGYGLHGFHMMRQENWWKAFLFGNKARHFLKRLTWEYPEFYDVYMGLGMYTYYRSFYTRQLKFLPFFPDRRAQGIGQVRLAMEKGEYVRKSSEINLAIIYMNEQRFDEAISIFQKYSAEYPKNLLFKMFLAHAFFKMKRWPDSANLFAQVFSKDPQITKARYFQGLSLFKMGDESRYEEAKGCLNEFVRIFPDTHWQAWAHYWLGEIEGAKRNESEAQGHYRKAVELKSDFKEAKERLVKE